RRREWFVAEGFGAPLRVDEFAVERCFDAASVTTDFDVAVDATTRELKLLVRFAWKQHVREHHRVETVQAGIDGQGARALITKEPGAWDRPRSRDGRTAIDGCVDGKR